MIDLPLPLQAKRFLCRGFCLAAGASALLMTTHPARAQQSGDYCRDMGKVAETVMAQRQDRTPISDIINRWGTPPEAADEAALREIALLAYDLPRFRTEGERISATAAFRSAVERSCLEDGDTGTATP